MIKTKSYLLIFTIASIVLFQGCGFQGDFVIENKTKNPITIELIYDSLDISALITRDVIWKLKDQPHANSQHYRSYSELFDSIRNTLDEASLYQYLVDSMSLRSLITDDFSITKHDARFDYIEFPDQNIYEYYNHDTTRIENLLHNRIISFILPPNYSLLRHCEACPDCTCSGEFPTFGYIHGLADKSQFVIGEIKVIIKDSDYIVLTPGNFTRLMEDDDFDYVLKIE